MRWVLRILVAACVLGAGMGSAQPVAKRVALVIANANYTGYPALPNTATDAGLVRETLERAGFSSVVVKADVGVAAFRAALANFQSAAAQADVALVYYAGHAVEVGGRNWLLPLDAKLRSDADLLAQAVDAVEVFTAMDGAKTRIVVLDACRENPFEVQLRAAGARGVGRGLGAPTAASGLADLTRAGETAQGALLMYSAAPGRVAEDGVAGRGSPFARAFQKHFAETDVELRVAVGKISDAVAAETNNRQLPFSTLSLSGVPIVFLRNEDRPAPPAPTTPGTEFRDCDVCPLMVVVPAGNFMMGSPASEIARDVDEGPQRQVTITRPFSTGKFEVTFAEWDACVADEACAQVDDEGWGRGTHPAINVSWYDAQRYLRWLNGRVGGHAYRLLTEAEWEYSARAGTTSAFRTGASIPPHHALFRQPEINGGATTSTVGAYSPNAFKLHDLHGNVWEWVEDCYADSYLGAPSDGSAMVVSNCAARVYRGGAWNYRADGMRSANRERSQPADRDVSLGFRVARGGA